VPTCRPASLPDVYGSVARLTSSRRAGVCWRRAEAVAWGRWRGVVYNGRQGGLQLHVGDAAGGLKRQMPSNDDGDYDITVKRANEKFVCKT
jgi:hypothetical protein